MSTPDRQHPLAETYADPQFQRDYWQALAKEYERGIEALRQQVTALTEERDKWKALAEAHRQDSETLDTIDAAGSGTLRENVRQIIEERDRLKAENERLQKTSVCPSSEAAE